jgi:hypothetical protein
MNTVLKSVSYCGTTLLLENNAFMIHVYASALPKEASMEI